MDKITVDQIANEFNVQAQVVVGELKKLGIYVSPASSVDAGLADRVRKKLQHRKELEEAALQQTEEKKSAKKAPAKEKEKEAKPRRLVSKSRRPVEAVVEPPAPEPKPTPRLMPRKGRLKAADYLPAAAAGEAIGEALAEEKVVTAPLAEPEAPIDKKKKVAAVKEPAESGVERKDAFPAPVSARPSVPSSPEKERAVPVLPAETPTAPPASEPRIAASVPAQRVEAPRVQEKSAPPTPKVPKPQILKKTVAEGPAVPTEIAERIFKAPTERPTFDRTQSRGRFVPRRDKDQPKKVTAVASPIKLKEPVVPSLPKEFKPVNLTEGINVKELAERLDVKAKYIMQKLLQKGIFTTINQTLDTELVKQICAEFGYIPNILSFEEEAAVAESVHDKPEENEPRPPVVTIMGHVDHGKTTLLDAIRESRITEREAGGITQHIGAYKVNIRDFATNGQHGDRSIVFLDTPGHEAFTRMRSRGAQVTDIVILVVSADDGVMPQTVEAIHHAKAANVPIIVAVNKIDKPNAQPDRVKQQLVDHGLVPEAWGGDTVTVDISAKTRINIDLLLEMILLVADLRELKANPKKPATGVVLEARLDRTRGAVATVLVQNGTLRIGDTFLAGAVYGKVRAMFDDRGRGVREAPPSTPVEVLGMEGVPLAGDRFMVLEDVDKIKKISLYRQSLLREQKMVKSARLTLDQLYEQLKQGNVKELPLILKADVQGSVEVLTDTLNKLSTEKVKIRIIHSGTGAITESDVLLASASNAIIIGFNVRPERKAADLAEQESVDIRLHTIIYNITNEIKSAMVGLLETTYKEKRLGTAEVRTTFRVPSVGMVAGSYVSSGLIKRGASVRLLRDNVVIYEGRISSLRRFKDDVDEVKNGYECGITLERFNDVKDNDVIEAYLVEKVQPTASQL